MKVLPLIFLFACSHEVIGSNRETLPVETTIEQTPAPKDNTIACFSSGECASGCCQSDTLLCTAIAYQPVVNHTVVQTCVCQANAECDAVNKSVGREKTGDPPQCESTHQCSYLGG